MSDRGNWCESHRYRLRVFDRGIFPFVVTFDFDGARRDFDADLIFFVTVLIALRVDFC